MKNLTNITITVPTGTPGELAYFKIEFPKEKFNQVIESVGSITNINGVLLAEKAGEFKII